MARRQNGKEARLGRAAAAPVSRAVLAATALNRQALSFQVRALVRLVDDLLKGETKAIAVETALFPDLRLPGENHDDALRYLLRGLRNEMRNLDGALKAMETDPGAPRSRLGPLHDHAVAVAQVFSSAPETGAGRAVLAMIGGVLDQSGLMPWPEFLRRYGGAHAKPWAEVDVSGEAARAPGKAAQILAPRSLPPESREKGKHKREGQAKGKDKPKDKAKVKAKEKSKGKGKGKGKKHAFDAFGPFRDAAAEGALGAPGAVGAAAITGPATQPPSVPGAVEAAAAPAPEADPVPAARPPSAPAPVARATSAPGASDAEDPLEIPLILFRPLQGDWARALFKRGLAYLTKVYGEPPEKLRPVLGHWVAQSGDDHQKVFRLLARAQTQKEPDPKGWVSNILMQGEGATSAA